jgi:hypothetical protein
MQPVGHTHRLQSEPTSGQLLLGFHSEGAPTKHLDGPVPAATLNQSLNDTGLEPQQCLAPGGAFHGQRVGLNQSQNVDTQAFD